MGKNMNIKTICLMKKILKLTLFLLAMAIAVAGCNSSAEMNDEDGITEMTNGDDGQPASLMGTQWKSEGIVDAKTGALTILEPSCETFYMPNCEGRYTIIFETDSTLFAFSSTNKMNGNYKIDSERQSIQIFISLMTYVCEMGDGELWRDIFPRIEYYSLQEDKLRFYYNEKNNYLLFKQIQP